MLIYQRVMYMSYCVTHDMYIYIYMGSVHFPGPKGIMIRIGYSYHDCLFKWKTH